MLSADRNVLSMAVFVLWSWSGSNCIIPQIFERARPLDENSFLPSFLLESKGYRQTIIVDADRDAYGRVACRLSGIFERKKIWHSLHTCLCCHLLANESSITQNQGIQLYDATIFLVYIQCGIDTLDATFVLDVTKS